MKRVLVQQTDWTHSVHGIDQVQEQKGLDMVRRDWCPLSKDVGNFALREILSAKPKEDVVTAIHDHLNKVWQADFAYTEWLADSFTVAAMQCPACCERGFLNHPAIVLHLQDACSDQ